MALFPSLLPGGPDGAQGFFGLREWLRSSRVRSVAKFCAQPLHAWEARLSGPLHGAGHQSSWTCAESHLSTAHRGTTCNSDWEQSPHIACAGGDQHLLCVAYPSQTRLELAQRACSRILMPEAAGGIELRSVIFGVLMILFTEFTVGGSKSDIQVLF